MKRKVLAPYNAAGKPQDWSQEGNGNYRLTHPPNIWTDLTIPFWSMPENTDHPTQKPEKIMAELAIASCRKGDFVFDPFLGSGTTAVAAKKLDRLFCGMEIDEEYCCWALKRLEKTTSDPTIQGYADGVFWERNSQADQSGSNTQHSMQGKVRFSCETVLITTMEPMQRRSREFKTTSMPPLISSLPTRRTVPGPLEMP